MAPLYATAGACSYPAAAWAQQKLRVRICGRLETLISTAAVCPLIRWPPTPALRIPRRPVVLAEP